MQHHHEKLNYWQKPKQKPTGRKKSEIQ